LRALIGRLPRSDCRTRMWRLRVDSLRRPAAGGKICVARRAGTVGYRIRLRRTVPGSWFRKSSNATTFAGCSSEASADDWRRSLAARL